jgi:hypothetical protein
MRVGGGIKPVVRLDFSVRRKSGDANSTCNCQNGYDCFAHRQFSLFGLNTEHPGFQRPGGHINGAISSRLVPRALPTTLRPRTQGFGRPVTFLFERVGVEMLKNHSLVDCHTAASASTPVIVFMPVRFRAFASYFVHERSHSNGRGRALTRQS